MESLLLFGISEVNMFNSTLRDLGPSHYYTKALHHYMNIRKLSIKQLPFPFKTRTPPSRKYDYNAVETMRMIATNDCLYRNMDKYDYILHIDRDEVVVPKSYNTYQEFLKSVLAPNLDNKYESIIIQSAFFYKQYSPFKQNIPQCLPLNRLSYRTQVEKITKGNVGFSKPFNNPKKMHKHVESPLYSWQLSGIIADKKDILVHHYRNSCRMGTRCAHEWERRKLDATLHDKYGAVLQQRTLEVLREIQYPVS